jgi:carbonic anhydrase
VKADPRPARGIAIVTCMDCRLDVLGALGLSLGEAHVIRNAGGEITEDVLRSLAISQERLGTREVIVMHHTNCAAEGIDLGEEVRKVREAEALPHRDQVRGLLYETDTDMVSELER